MPEKKLLYRKTGFAEISKNIFKYRSENNFIIIEIIITTFQAGC